MTTLRYWLADHFQGVVHRAEDWITAAVPLTVTTAAGYAWHGAATVLMLAPVGALAGYAYLTGRAGVIRQAATREGIPTSDYVVTAP